MRIAILAAGAAGMYCGSCLRDTNLAAALAARGHDVSFVPLYTSVRADESPVQPAPIFFGGVNVYLRHKVPLFHLVPRTLGRLLDSDAVLGLAGRFAGMTSAADLGALTVSVLQGATGSQAGELSRLLDFLAKLQPDVVQLPNAFFIGIAEPIRTRLSIGRPRPPAITCSLTGEDIFLDSLPGDYRVQALGIIRRAVAQVDAFIASSEYYAARAAELFAIPGDSISVVWSSVNASDFVPASHANTQPVVGYMARICPEKGLDVLAAAVRLVREKHAIPARLRAAGWLGPQNRAWFDSLRRDAQQWAARTDPRQTAPADSSQIPLIGSPQAPPAGPRQTPPADSAEPAFEYLGEVDRAGKIAMLSSIDVLSVPTRYPEAKGIYVLEALAAGVPVVQPEHGSFPELIRDTGGGVLVPPNDPAALADAIAALLRDPARRKSLGRAGRVSVAERYSHDSMAGKTAEVYRRVVS